MTWREIRASARAQVQDTFKVRALYLTTIPYDSNSGVVVPEIECRIHNSEKALGINPQLAEDVEPQPKIIFWVANLEAAGVTLARLGVVSVEDGEAYRVMVIHPQDRETITADVVPLTAAQLIDLPVPE